MKYEKIVTGIFQDRPNRFIANVEIDGQVQRCHVCNTGRCKELLVPGCRVYLKVCDNPKRTTAYDLVVVDKTLKDGNIRRVNMDSYAPNRVAKEWLEQGGMGGDVTEIVSEKKYGNSRFDLYFKKNGKKSFMEVKGVTLENQGIAAVSMTAYPRLTSYHHYKSEKNSHGAGAAATVQKLPLRQPKQPKSLYLFSGMI